MSKQDPWFLQERAFAFASLVLTKRNDVVVRAHAGQDMAVDLLVEVLKKGKSTLRFFGVQLVACLDLPNLPEAEKRVLSHFPGNPFEAELPICVFVIGVRKPEGIYRWVVEPVIQEGRAILRREVLSKGDLQAKWQSLDEAGAARLIDQVNAWYDARNGGPLPSGQSHHAHSNS
jgi:hypothetical protein